MKHFTILIVAFAFFTFSGPSLPGGVFEMQKAEAATKAQWRNAKRACRKKYGKRLLRTTISSTGRITCTYRKRQKAARNLTYEEVQKYCNNTYRGYASVTTRKIRGKWFCMTRQ